MSDLDDHLHCGKGGGDVLRVRWSHRDGNAAGIQAAIEGSDEVDTYGHRQRRTEGSGLCWPTFVSNTMHHPPPGG